MLTVLLLGALTADPVCGVVRDEDQLMSRQQPLATSYGTILALAHNWIEVRKLLDPQTFFGSANAGDRARLEPLRARLQRVADDQNDALNVPENAVAAQAAAVAPPGAGFAPELTRTDDRGKMSAEISHHGGELERTFLERLARMQSDELAVYPALAPILSECGRERRQS